MIKVCFLNPPAQGKIKQVREGRCMQRAGAWTAVWAPITLATSAAVLRQDGMEVMIYDGSVEGGGFKEAIELVTNFKPRLGIINAVTPAIIQDLAFAKAIKDMDKSINIAAIGIFGTALPGECLGLGKGLDFVIRGEPEQTISELAYCLDADGDISKIDGLSYRIGDRAVHNRDRAPIADLDQLPFPAWGLVDRGKYIMPLTKKPFLLVGTSRGCPYPCSFCADTAFYGRKLRLRSPKRIADELEHNVKTYGTDEFLFWSESFTLNPRFPVEVADEIIRRRLKIKWVCNSRVDNVDLRLLKRIKEAGCYMIGFGIESASQAVLDRYRKKATVQDAIRAVNMCKEVGLEVVAHCVIGFPGEDEESIRKTIEFAKELDVDFAQFYCAVPFPGSEFYWEARERGWLNTDDWSLFEQNYSVLDTEQISAKKVMELRRQAYKSFYLRPKMFLKVLKTRRKDAGLIKLLGAGKRFLEWL